MVRTVAIVIGLACLQAPVTDRGPTPPPVRAAYRHSAADDALLDDMSRRAFRFLCVQADPSTGLVRDRARTNGSTFDEALANAFAQFVFASKTIGGSSE